MLNQDAYLQRVKEVVGKTSVSTIQIPIYVESYRKIVDEWVRYNSGRGLTHDNFQVRGIFEFHKTHNDHVILFHGLHFNECLLLCKFDGIYKFVSIPCEDNLIYNRNFIATYV